MSRVTKKKKAIEYIALFCFLISNSHETLVHAVDFSLLPIGNGWINFENKTSYGLANSFQIFFGGINGLNITINSFDGKARKIN